MKKIFNLFFTAMVLSVVLSSCNAQSNKLNAGQFEEKIKSENSVLVDVRTANEFASGHIKGAVHIDFYSPDFMQRIKKIDPSKTILLYCHSGNRSGQAARLLAKANYHNVYDLAGGISSWTAAGKPTE